MDSVLRALVPIKVTKPKKQPPLVPSDTIVPLYTFDNTWLVRNDCLVLALHFDAVLSPHALTTALNNLISCPLWNKVGSRIRVQGSKSLEYHIPKSFSADRPAFHYTHLNLSSQKLCDHPLGSKIPTVTATPCFQTPVKELLPILVDLQGPKFLIDWLGSDEPLLSFHITSFEDSTLLSFTWPHIAMDMMGFASFLRGYVAVLHGRTNSIPQMIGFDTDPTFEIGRTPSRFDKNNKLSPHKGWKVVKILLGMIYEDEMRGTIQIPTFCLPATMIAFYKRKALHEIQTKHGAAAFVSENDVICALLLKAAVADLSAKSKRAISVMGAVGLRGRQEGRMKPDDFYMGNLVGPAFSIFSSQQQIKDASITDIAWQLRVDLKEQSSLEVMDQIMYDYRKGAEMAKEEVVAWGLPYNRFILYSSFVAGDFYRVADFSPALTTRPQLSEPLLPKSVLSHKYYRLPSTWNIRVHGKDLAGNVFVRIYLPKKAAFKFEQELLQLNAQVETDAVNLRTMSNANTYLNDLFSLKGRTAVVTGASRGIGRSLAVGLAKAGCACLILPQRDLSNTETKQEIEALGVECLLVECDVLKHDQVKRLTEVITKQHQKRIDILINNAGIQRRNAPEDFTDEDWNDVIQANLTSCFTLTRDMGKHMLETQASRGFRGKIVQIASILSYSAAVRVPAYASAKHGLLGLAQSFSNEWSSRDINVNCLSPGWIATEFSPHLRADPALNHAIVSRIPLGRWAHADELIGATIFLCSPASDYVCGISLPVEGGWLGR